MKFLPNFCWSVLAYFSFGLGFVSAQTNSVIVKAHLTRLTKTKGYRTYTNIPLLDKTAAYIDSVFKQYSDSVGMQPFLVEGRKYNNVICSFGTENSERIIIGAHYDVCGEQEGADDNASGVVGLLELARQLKDKKLKYRIDLVAYTLEEPPFFRTEHMGSYVHAKYLKDHHIAVFGMVSLEMIAYFKEEKKSQSYPLKALRCVYGSKGNYITLVNKFGSGTFARQFTRSYKSTKTIRTKEFKGPKSLVGIDFSDHLNYWQFGFSALMLTDTGFYRNHNYHQKTDTLETLDLTKMTAVIDALYDVILQLK
jgi:hypothetical protein